MEEALCGKCGKGSDLRKRCSTAVERRKSVTFLRMITNGGPSRTKSLSILMTQPNRSRLSTSRRESYTEASVQRRLGRWDAWHHSDGAASAEKPENDPDTPPTPGDPAGPCPWCGRDESHGEEVKAFVILKPSTSATADELVAWSKDQMASYKYPRIVEIASSLPMTATGKILKRELS